MDMPDRERNTAATFAETGTARHNLSMLLRKSSARRYAEIARITGHDKSWVSRFLSGSAPAAARARRLIRHTPRRRVAPA